MQNWTMLANATFDASREARVFKLLSKVSGVYRSRAKARRVGVERAVLVSVVSIGSSTSETYMSLLKNWLCYTAHYDYQPLVYYIRPDSIEGGDIAESYFKEARELNRNAIFLEYPTHLFWSLMTQKTDWKVLAATRQVIDLRGGYPSFAHHGALVMLVPLLEVLSLGFSAIYLDIDIALVKDPVPFMAIGKQLVDCSTNLLGSFLIYFMCGA